MALFLANASLNEAIASKALKIVSKKRAVKKENSLSKKPPKKKGRRRTSIAYFMCPGGAKKSTNSEHPVYGCTAPKVEHPIDPLSFKGNLIVKRETKNGPVTFGRNIYEVVPIVAAMEMPELMVAAPTHFTPVGIKSIVMDEDAFLSNAGPQVKRFDPDALDELNALWRCRNTGVERAIKPKLFAILAAVHEHFGQPIELLSGYRRQERTSSYHSKGSASDIRVNGVSPKELVAFLKTLDDGHMGIGIYSAGFVHVDTNRDSSYYWVDPALMRSGKKKNHPRAIALLRVFLKNLSVNNLQAVRM